MRFPLTRTPPSFYGRGGRGEYIEIEIIKIIEEYLPGERKGRVHRNRNNRNHRRVPGKGQEGESISNRNHQNHRRVSSMGGKGESTSKSKSSKSSKNLCSGGRGEYIAIEIIENIEEYLPRERKGRIYRNRNHRNHRRVSARGEEGESISKTKSSETSKSICPGRGRGEKIKKESKENPEEML